MTNIGKTLRPAALCACLAVASSFATAVTTDLGIDAAGAVSIAFDPFAGVDAVETLSLSLSNSGDEPRQVVLEIVPEVAHTLELTGVVGDALPFDIEAAGQGSDGQRFRLPLTLDPGETVQDVAFRIPTGQVPAAGDARLDLLTRLLDPVTLQPMTDDEALTALAVIPARAQTNFAGVSAGYLNGTTNALVDFGEIAPGAMRNIVLQVRANTEAIIAVSSENGGVLMDEEGGHGLAYQLDVDGQPCDLGTGCSLTRTPERSLAGSAYPMDFRIAADAQPMAGVYRDVVVVDVNPL